MRTSNLTKDFLDQHAESWRWYGAHPIATYQGNDFLCLWVSPSVRFGISEGLWCVYRLEKA